MYMTLCTCLLNGSGIVDVVDTYTSLGMVKTKLAWLEQSVQVLKRL